jgi:hypothetical protein
VTIGHLAGVPLQATFDLSGAVFLLRQAPKNGKSVEIDGWTTTLTQGKRFVVVYGGTERTIDEVRSAALPQANAGLDYLSAQGVADVLISDADDHTIVWALDAGQATMRVTGMMPMSPEFRATGRATDAQDNLVHQPVPTPVVSDAMRFLRMSRTSEALFDAYRYAFLALESLLHDVHPQSARGEAAWFKDALRAADPLVAVAGLAPTGETDPAGWVYANVYSDLRSGLMHAKRDYHLPGDESRRADIAQSLESISVYTLELLRKRHGIVRGRGQLSRYAWRYMAETVFGKLRPAVTNDMTTIDLSEPLFAPAGGTTVELPPSPVQHGDSALSCIIGSSDGNDVRALGPLGRIGAVFGSGDAAAFFDVPFGLEVGESVTRFEVLVGMVNPRPGGIRTRFMM